MEEATTNQGNGKKIIKPKTHSVKGMYAYFKDKNPTTDIPYWMYNEILSRYNKKAADAVIFGEVLNLGNTVGRILIKKIRRRYDKLEVDWGASNIRKAELIAQGITPKDPEHPEGENWILYHTDAWYARWAWQKRNGACKVRNQSVYKFLPSSNRSKKAGDVSLDKLGNKGKLALAIRCNPGLHLIYETKPAPIYAKRYRPKKIKQTELA
jgi:hypothetical protein